MPLAAAIPERTVTLGVGAATGASAEGLRALVEAALAAANVPPASLRAIASIDRKRDEPAILALAAALRLPLQLYSAERLDGVAVARPARLVAEATGSASVAEAAALAAAGPGSRLLLPKQKGDRVTCALAIQASQ